jgi:hypothetical protein
MWDKYYGPGATANPQSSFRQPPLSNPPPVDPQRQVTPPPPVRLERIVLGTESTLEGQVVRLDNAPRAGARLLFVSANLSGPRHEVTANATGRFHVALASGSWNVFVSRPDGGRDYHSRIEVTGNQPPFLTLVSR